MYVYKKTPIELLPDIILGGVWGFLLGGILFGSLVTSRLESRLHEFQKQAAEYGYGEYKIVENKIQFTWKQPKQ